MAILSLNAGSATVKYGLFTDDASQRLAHGAATRIGEAAGRIEHTGPDGTADTRDVVLADHGAAFRTLLADLLAEATPHCGQPITAVGHRVVHGGDRFTAPTRIDDHVLATIRALGALAPLHNEVAARGIAASREMLPGVPHIGVFDTAFHASMPPAAARYAIPDRYADAGYRRYGFHGISHRFVAEEAARALGRPLESLRLITLHLGAGASATAIRDGASVDTSMGMTPLEGLVMGTRCGDVDPGAVLRMAGEADGGAREIERLLNHESGLLALAGTGDMRDIEARAGQGDARAEDAIAIFCYRVKKYIGAYYAALGGIDALVFTGGIGEHSSMVRARSCAGLEALGIAIDAKANAADARSIHAGPVPVLVIPSDEARAIARAVAAMPETRNP